MNIIDLLKSDESDKRYFRRFGVDLPANVCELQFDENQVPIKSDCLFGAAVKDMSLSGLCFISKQRYDVGQTVEVTATILNTPVTLIGAVRRCRRDRVASNYYDMGIQYIKHESNTMAIPVIAKFLQQHNLPVKKP